MNEHPEQIEYDNIVNQQFTTLFKDLQDQGKIKGKSDIARVLGTYNHVINDIIKGKRNLTLEQINNLMEAFKVNANFLFGRTNQMYLKEGQSSDVNFLAEKIQKGRNNITLVPERAMAGYALAQSENNSSNYLQEQSFPRFAIPGFEGQLIAFEISGDSMLPNITSGDLVICEPVERGVPLKDNAVYVIVTDIVVAKRIQQVKENNRTVRLRLISDNKNYPPYEVEADEIRQILQVKCRVTAHGIL
jgi:phage repressor protein C with HTH and peptisase S24 domain